MPILQVACKKSSKYRLRSLKLFRQLHLYLCKVGIEGSHDDRVIGDLETLDQIDDVGPHTFQLSFKYPREIGMSSSNIARELGVYQRDCDILVPEYSIGGMAPQGYRSRIGNSVVSLAVIKPLEAIERACQHV